MFVIDPNLKLLPLDAMRPTQLTVGMRKVTQKRKDLKDMPARKRKAHMTAQLYPAVKGPDKRFYILDHHHEALAALREGASEVSVGLVSDLSQLSKEAFWVFLDHRSWVHCYDQHGRRRDFADVPKRLDDLADDPYRSLAASVEDAGGFAKPDEPFYEFLWANHFRAHVAADLLQRKYERAVAEALRLARSAESRFLPGWAGEDKGG
jgi:hypothetical protein